MTITMSIRIDEDLKEDILNYGSAHEMNASQVIRRAVKEFLAKEKGANEQNEQNNLFVKSDGAVGADGAYTCANNAESKKYQI